jgi:hypothetical protein
VNQKKDDGGDEVCDDDVCVYDDVCDGAYDLLHELERPCQVLNLF